MGYIIGCIFLVILCFIAFPIIKVTLTTTKGKRYWDYCEKRFRELVAQGHSRKDALIRISKERHPELDDQVHDKIVEKCPDVTRLANFIYNVLDFRPAWQSGYGRKLSNDEAEALLECTTISAGGGVNTNFGAVKEKLQQK